MQTRKKTKVHIFLKIEIVVIRNTQLLKVGYFFIVSNYFQNLLKRKLNQQPLMSGFFLLFNMEL
ncbi:MAG TPA: hypothetical protein DCW42_06085 [Bacteroidetes bacterium]|nr:hypothetical protein [Bacteroidota bacterium]